ncbi:MAG: AI-2E family transporter [Planctomycetes bacterium]|nr:AI-2E family transporter [Planctomycetota bacterium]
MESEKHYTLDRVVRMVLSAAGIIAVLLLVRYLSDVLVPFVVAVVLAYFLNPLVNAVEKKTNHRGLAVGLTLGGLGLVGIALVLVIAPLTINQAGRFRDSLQKLRDEFQSSSVVNARPAMPATSNPQNAGETDLPEGEKEAEGTALGWQELLDGWEEYRNDAEKIARPIRLQRLRARIEGTYLGDAIQRTIDYTRSDDFNAFLIDAAKQLLVGGWTVLAFMINLVLGLTGLIIVLLYLFFLLADYPAYAATWKTFLPPRYRKEIVEFLEQFSIAMRRYFRGQAVVALIMGVLFAVGFSIVGLPMAVPLGFFVGLLNMVPYLQVVGLLPAALLAGLRAVENDSSFAVSLLLAGAVFAVAQLLQDAVIVPRIMGKATGLKPVAILLGIFIWGKLLGFLGLLMAIPLTCLGIAYYRRFVLLQAAEASKITED